MKQFPEMLFYGMIAMTFSIKKNNRMFGVRACTFLFLGNDLCYATVLCLKRLQGGVYVSARLLIFTRTRRHAFQAVIASPRVRGVLGHRDTHLAGDKLQNVPQALET